MNTFDKIIGYEAIKKELMQICDMIKNPGAYKKLGAKLPQGVLLHGEPGLGKTLIATAFIESCGLRAYTLRKNRGSADFIANITNTFKEAKENAPCIVFLDDMDKFANEDYSRRDTEEYVAIQAGIDDVKDCEVFVIATANDIDKMPGSLLRSGRFDRRILVEAPNDKDAEGIIEYYLRDKVISADVNMEDLSKMISYSSCAELETMLNEAAISAACARKEKIEMCDLTNAVLRLQYESPDDFSVCSDETMLKSALHEAGHIVVCETLEKGSVGLASIRTTDATELRGFIHRCKSLPGGEAYVMVGLAGKAAVELYYSDTCTYGCSDDIRKSFSILRKEMTEEASLGFGMVNFTHRRFDDTSDEYLFQSEVVTQAQLEYYMVKTRKLLLENRAFLENLRDALLAKETLLYSDIQVIRQKSITNQHLNSPI